jgi:predicted alpha/beta-hydrolase family hydrolase
MGGSFDDPLLDIVAEQLLRKGYLLGTFNFRYACRAFVSSALKRLVVR